MPLLGRGRRDVQVTLAFEDCSCYFAVDLTVKSKTPAAEPESGRITFEFEILDCDNFATRQQPTQLLVYGVGVRKALRGERAKATREKKNKGQ